jgi:putative FmdB family regulatory protein
MAIYEYECEKCHHQFETITKKPTNKIEKCPKCGDASKRLISKSSFRLKDGGVGWADKGYSNK